MRYRDFTLVLSEANQSDDTFDLRVQVMEAAGLPIVIEPVTVRCDLAGVRALSGADPTHPLDMDAQLEAGSALGRALLPGIVGQRVHEALALVRSRDEGLRLRIIGGNVVHCVPWEYVVLAPRDGEASETDFLALMPDVSIVRDQSIPSAAWPKAAPPFRIAAAAAHPRCTGQLDVDRERALLEDALHDVRDTVEIAWCPRGRRPSSATKAQMFHFAGHGAFEPSGLAVRRAGDPEARVRDLDVGGHASSSPGDSSVGSLIFEAADGSVDRLSAGQLGVILRDMGVRVAVLNACRTASRDGTRSWSSVAAALLKAGVRSVVAMQHAVLDDSAIAFAAALYRSLALGGSLDEAARNGRMAMFDRGDVFGWGTPVLYSGRSEGAVFSEACNIGANRTQLHAIDERIRRSYRSRVVSQLVVPHRDAPGVPAQPVRLRAARSSRTTIAVICLRCGVQARNEQPRRYDEEMAYLCTACRAAVLDSPSLPAGYRAVQQLGRGTMGAVYLAAHPLHGHRAVKLIVPRAATSRQAASAFVRELSAVSALQHENIVRAFECCELSPGVFCMTMEHVAGWSLVDLIRRNPHGVEPRWAVDITLQILDGLAHAHARDFIHRDIKESNLLVDATDRVHLKVKIADFGLAKSYEMLGARGFTRTDDVPALAPWGDLYSTGAVLHRLLTGQHAHDVRPHRVSSSLAAVAERAMRKDPARRFRNAIEMRQALLAVTDAPQAGDQVAAHTGRSRR